MPNVISGQVLIDMPSLLSVFMIFISYYKERIKIFNIRFFWAPNYWLNKKRRATVLKLLTLNMALQLVTGLNALGIGFPVNTLDFLLLQIGKKRVLWF